jgi:hypothetical protein
MVFKSMSKPILVSLLSLMFAACSPILSEDHSCEALKTNAVEILDPQLDTLIAEYKKWDSGIFLPNARILGKAKDQQNAEDLKYQIESFQGFLKEVQFSANSGFESALESILKMAKSPPKSLNTDFPLRFSFPMAMRSTSRIPGFEVNHEKVQGSLLLLQMIDHNHSESSKDDRFNIGYARKINLELGEMIGKLDSIKMRLFKVPTFIDTLAGLQTLHAVVDGQFARFLGDIIQQASIVEIINGAGGSAELRYLHCLEYDDKTDLKDLFPDSEHHAATIKTFQTDSVLEWPASTRADIEYEYTDFDMDGQKVIAWPSFVLTNTPELWKTALNRVGRLDNNTFLLRAWFFQLAYLRGAE